MKAEDYFSRFRERELSQLADEILACLDSELMQGVRTSEDELLTDGVRASGEEFDFGAVAEILRRELQMDGIANMSGGVMHEVSFAGKEHKAAKETEPSFERRLHGRAGFTEKAGERSLSGGVFESGFEVETSDVELERSELSERLSERFCRDSRRYDGAFERY